MKDFQFLDYHTEYSCKGAFKKDMDVEACFSFVFRHTDEENVSEEYEVILIRELIFLERSIIQIRVSLQRNR